MNAVLLLEAAVDALLYWCANLSAVFNDEDY